MLPTSGFSIKLPKVSHFSQRSRTEEQTATECIFLPCSLYALGSLRGGSVPLLAEDEPAHHHLWAHRVDFGRLGRAEGR